MACSSCGRKGGKTRRLSEKYEVRFSDGKTREVSNESEAKYLVSTRGRKGASYRKVPSKS